MPSSGSVTASRSAVARHAVDARLAADVLGTASVAFNEDPLLYGYGGILVETLDRSSVGAVAGVRVLVGKVRLAGGGVRIFKPYTLWGGVVSVGTCKRVVREHAGMRLGEVTAYFAGDDLPSGHTVMQAQLVMSMVFDAP